MELLIYFSFLGVNVQLWHTSIPLAFMPSKKSITSTKPAIFRYFSALPPWCGWFFNCMLWKILVFYCANHSRMWTWCADGAMQPKPKSDGYSSSCRNTRPNRSLMVLRQSSRCCPSLLVTFTEWTPFGWRELPTASEESQSRPSCSLETRSFTVRPGAFITNHRWCSVAVQKDAFPCNQPHTNLATNQSIGQRGPIIWINLDICREETWLRYAWTVAECELTLQLCCRYKVSETLLDNHGQND